MLIVFREKQPKKLSKAKLANNTHVNARYPFVIPANHDTCSLDIVQARLYDGWRADQLQVFFMQRQLPRPKYG